MGKKLRGRQGIKATRGKGKGSLVHAAKLARKMHNARQVESAKRRRGENMKLAQKKERRKKNAFVPYTVNDTILLVGEGNFSFARALVRRYQGVATRLVATSYDTKEEVLSKYPEFPIVLEELEAAGVTIVYGVDCTALESNTTLQHAVHTMQQALASSSEQVSKTLQSMAVFDKIVFNFPHTACGIKDTAENNRVHQRLLTAFFNAAIPLQKPATITKNWVGKKNKPVLSQIHVTLKTGEPYTSWQVGRLARLTGQLRLQTAIDFYPGLYSGYEHRRTRGGFKATKEDVKAGKKAVANIDISKIGNKDTVGARTYIFVSTTAIVEKQKLVEYATQLSTEADGNEDEEDSESDNDSGAGGSYPGAGNW